MFEVEDYTVILVGRHRIGIKNGIPIGLYAPDHFKGPKDEKTGLTKVLIQRKIV